MPGLTQEDLAWIEWFARSWHAAALLWGMDPNRAHLERLELQEALGYYGCENEWT